MVIPVIVAAIYGLLFGSFANAVAYRVPNKETLWSRSHCPKCDAQINWWQNIPVLSWVALRGKCANCKNPISVQYPLVELLTSALFAVMAYVVTTLGMDLVPGILLTVVLCYFSFIAVVLSIIDFKTMTLPTVLIYPTLGFSAVMLTVTALVMGDPAKFLWMIVGSLISAGFYFIIWFIRPGAIGFGDVRLALLTGAILGWFSLGYVILAVLASFVIMSVVFAPLMLAKIVGPKTKAPFGPWIIVATIGTIIWGDIVIDSFLTVGGFL